jgi:7,8-didemethyl-8-hydroxy-5-deazariboflavin synthase CofG subunit
MKGKGTERSKRGPITYSPSVTVTISHDCPWHCRYCGFRTDHEGLISDEEIEQILETGRQSGATEALLISGEQPHQMKPLVEEAQGRGYPDLWSFVEAVAERCLAAGLYPHGNYGALRKEAWERLRASHVSMGVMLETIEDHPEVAPEKRVAGRLRAIAEAGEARVPFTTGLLLGAGESRDSRFRSLEALAELQQCHGHLQEILLQPCVPNDGFRLERVEPVSSQDLTELIIYWRERCPEVAVQIPPNVTACLEEVIPLIDDLGGISPLRDEVNQTSPWKEVETYRKMARQADRELVPRHPVYDSYRTEEWLAPRFAGLFLESPA